MANPSKSKGTAFETAVVRHLAAWGARRNALSGSNDIGDIRLLQWTLEAKCRRVYDFGSALDEARIEAANAGTPYYAAVIKRNGVGDVARAFVVLDLETFEKLLD